MRLYVGTTMYAAVVIFYALNIGGMTSLVFQWSELLTTNHEVPGSIPGSTMGIFIVGGGSPW